MGDASDNYPGVRGIGEKTAIRLLQEFSSIDRVVENLDRLPAGVRKKIEADRDMLELSRTLATIKTDVPLACEPDDFAWQGPAETAVGLFEELELGRLLNRFTPRVRRR
jgi:5'-3' exonuclease